MGCFVATRMQVAYEFNRLVMTIVKPVWSCLKVAQYVANRDSDRTHWPILFRHIDSSRSRLCSLDKLTISVQTDQYLQSVRVVQTIDQRPTQQLPHVLNPQEVVLSNVAQLSIIKHQRTDWCVIRVFQGSNHDIVNLTDLEEVVRSWAVWLVMCQHFSQTVLKLLLNQNFVNAENWRTPLSLSQISRTLIKVPDSVTLECEASHASLYRIVDQHLWINKVLLFKPMRLPSNTLGFFVDAQRE